MKHRRTWISALLTVALAMSTATASFAMVGAEPRAVVYYTNDIHGAYENLAKIMPLVKADGGLLVDAGDAIQGSVAATLTGGRAMVDVMAAMGYDVMIPGNHEFDFGMENFLAVAEESGRYISANFQDISGKEPRRVLDAYKIIDLDGDDTTDDDQLAFIGVTTPLTRTSSTPAFFQDETGAWKYDFMTDMTGELLFDCVQAAIDQVEALGADYVIALAHVGVEDAEEVFHSRQLIANTSGLDAVIDGHSHTELPQEMVSDKDGNPVLLTQTGAKLANVGRLEIGAGGAMTSRLIAVEALTEIDADVQAAVDQITEEIAEISDVVVAESEIDLAAYDPVTGRRLVRSSETNLGNLVTDAYRTILETDVAFCNGGGLRAAIGAGEVTNGEIIAVHPYGNLMCTAEVTGQMILDLLEYGVMEYPGENGSFMSVSGLTYEVHSYIPSGVQVDADEMFLGVTGDYRVKNVKIGGQPLDVNKTYTAGSIDYILQSGAYSMMNAAKTLRDEIMLDTQLLIRYMEDNLGGKISKGIGYDDPYGEGRITVVTEAPTGSESDAPVAPNAVVTRGMAVQMICAMDAATAGSRAGDSGSGAVENASAAKVTVAEAIAWAKANGVASGYTSGKFGENDPITRQQMATMLYQYAKFKGTVSDAQPGGADGSGEPGAALAAFKDAAQVSAYALPAMQWACDQKIMSGRTDGTLDPRGGIVRSEAQWMVGNYQK